MTTQELYKNYTRTTQDFEGIDVAQSAAHKVPQASSLLVESNQNTDQNNSLYAICPGVLTMSMIWESRHNSDRYSIGINHGNKEKS